MTKFGEVPNAIDGLSTEPAAYSSAWDWFDRALRSFAFLAIFGVVAAALLGFGGLTTKSATESNDVLRVTVFYAATTRPGIATPFRITIESVSGDPLPAELTVEVPTDYLAIFDENGLDPTPDSTASDGVIERWTFKPDGAPVWSIDYDARLQPNIHSGKDATVTVSSESTEPVSVSFHTRVFP